MPVLLKKGIFLKFEYFILYGHCIGTTHRGTIFADINEHILPLYAMIMSMWSFNFQKCPFTGPSSEEWFTALYLSVYVGQVAGTAIKLPNYGTIKKAVKHISVCLLHCLDIAVFDFLKNGPITIPDNRYSSY